MATRIGRFGSLSLIFATAAAIAADARDPRDADPNIGRPAPVADQTAGTPEVVIGQMLDGGVIELRRLVNRKVVRATNSGLPPGVKVEVTTGSIERIATEVVNVVETEISRMNANQLRARRVDGSAVPAKVLIDELKGPEPVILLNHGEQINPQFSKIFKPDALAPIMPPSTSPAIVPGSPRLVPPRGFVPGGK